MGAMAEPLYATQDINKAIRAQIKKGSTTKIEGLEGQHSIAVGLSMDAKVAIVGAAGDFFGALNNGTTLLITGNAGRYLGDTMKSGKIVVDGDVDSGCGANLQGGEIIVKGSAGDRAGAGAKGGSIIINGNAGDKLGMNLFGGDILITGDAGFDVGSYMLGGTIYVNGKISSLGKQTRLSRLDSHDKLKLTNYLTEQNISGEFKFRKVESEKGVPFDIIKNLMGLSPKKQKEDPSEGEEEG
ncbi:MAG: tributyrin esterase [Thermoplasmata archaeon]|nr:MAG: tributyrin esterase [Thermoplasmata archaeon]